MSADDVHECETCGQMCDCDGEDLDQPEPADHVCINEECGEDPMGPDDVALPDQLPEARHGK
jgi:hypothetical protein